MSCTSRLKLAEAVVWLKRIAKLEKLSGRVSVAFSVTGIAFMILSLVVGIADRISQPFVLIYLLLQVLAIVVITKLTLPHNKYFTVDNLYFELEKQEQMLQNIKTNKKNRKNSKEEQQES